MWNYNYPGKQIERVFNFSPKDWRKAPTYNLKDQTDSVNAKKLPYLLALATIEDEKRDNTLTIVRGILDLDHGKIADNILTLSLAELIKMKSEAKDTPEQSASAPEPETPENGQKEAKISTRKRKTANNTENAGTAVKSEIPTKQPEDDFVNNNLPWEKSEPGNVDVFFDPAESAQEPGPAKPTEQENLLNFEMEL